MSTIKNQHWNFWFFQTQKKCSIPQFWLDVVVNELALTFSASMKCAQAPFLCVITYKEVLRMLLSHSLRKLSSYYIIGRTRTKEQALRSTLYRPWVLKKGYLTVGHNIPLFRTNLVPKFWYVYFWVVQLAKAEPQWVHSYRKKGERILMFAINKWWRYCRYRCYF